MAVPIASALGQMQDGKNAAVVRTIAYSSPVIRNMYFKNIGKALTLKRSIDSAVASPAYLGLNASVSTYVQGSTRLVEETVARLVLAMRVDEAIKDLPSDFENEEKKQLRLGASALGIKFNEDFFLAQGLASASFNDSKGLYQIHADGIADGTIPAAMRISMAGQLTLEALDELLRVTQPPLPDMEMKRVLYMNSKLVAKLKALSRDPAYAGMLRISESKDAFGMDILKYDDAIVQKVERSDNFNSPLSFTETTTGRPTLGTGETATASIWCVCHGNEQGAYCFGQDGLGIQVRPFEKIPGQVYFDSVTPWYFNFVVDGPRAVGRLHSIDLPTLL